jgi:hypothetical protein
MKAEDQKRNFQQDLRAGALLRLGAMAERHTEL